MTTPHSQDRYDQESIETLAAAVSKAIEKNSGNKRFIDLERIPLICLSMSNMSKAVSEIKDMIAKNRTESEQQHEQFLTKESFRLEFDPIKALVNGGVALALLALGGAAISLLLK